MISEKQANDWFENPVTKAFFERIEDRTIYLRELPYLAQDAEETFRIGWRIQGGIEELDLLSITDAVDLSDKEAA